MLDFVHIIFSYFGSGLVKHVLQCGVKVSS